MRCSIRTRKRSCARTLIVAVLVIAVLGVAGWFGLRWFADRYQYVLPLDDQCTAIVNGQSVNLTPEQAKYAAIIAAEAQRRKLAPRAVSIALATAYQESGIRNLDHGDLDSVGLFQQRPSQDWGSVEQIMDPWYASGKFYEALVRIPNWQTGDLNDIAQKVQISAFPDAYRKHVQNARALASALTGETPASFGCRAPARPGGVTTAKKFVDRAFDGRVQAVAEGTTLRLSGDAPMVWSATQLLIASIADTGAVSASIGERSWGRDATSWKGASGGSDTAATVTFS